MNHHPLEGRREASIHCFDALAMRKLFGDEPLFIWDPMNPENRPDTTYQANAELFWNLYPAFLKELFVQAFTVGLTQPSRRVREGQWRGALSRLRDSILYCGSCGKQNFYDVDRMKAENGSPGQCWSCRRPLRLPPRIRVGKTTVMLNHDAQLFGHHVDEPTRYDFHHPVAQVNTHPTDPGKWGLKNLSDSHWTLITPDGEMRQIDRGAASPSFRRTRIQFGRAEGEIRV